MKEWQRGWGRRLAALVGVFFLWTAGEAAPSGKTFTTVDHPGAYPTPQNVAAALSDDGRRIVLQWDGVRWPVDGYPGVIDGRDVPTNFYYAVDCRTRASGAAEWDSWWNCSSLSRFASNYGVPGPFLDRVTLTRNAGPGTNYQFRVRCQCNAVWRGEGLYPTPNEDPDPTQDAYFSDWSETVQAYRTLDALALSLVEGAAPTPQGGKTTVEVAYTYTSSRADDGEEPLFFTFEAIEIPDDGWHPEAPAEGQKPYVRRDGTPLAVKTLHVRPPDAAQAVDPTNFTLTASSAAGETRRISWSAWRDLENYCHTNVTIRVQGWAKPEAAGAAPRRVLDEAIGNVGLDTRLPPQNVVASTNDTNAVTVVWDAVPDATGYEVTVESWGVAASHAERTVTTNEACLVDRELPLPGLGRYTVRAVYPNGLKGAASAAAVGWRALDAAEVTGLATRRPWNGTVDIDLACRTVRDKYAQAVDGASALPEKTVTVAVTTADGAAFAVQSLVRERLDASAGIIRREPVTNGSFTLGANDRIVWDARSDAPRMREPGAVLKVTLAGDAYGGPVVIERTFDLDTRTGLIDLPFGAENIRIPWSTRWAKPEVKEGGLGFGENDAWWKQTAVLTDVTDSANHVEILRTEAKLGEGTVCTWTPKNWGVNTLTLTLSPVSGSNERTEYAAVFRMPDFAFKVRAANEDGVTLWWRAVDGAATYEIRRRSAGGASGDFETVTNVTDATTWTDSSVDTIVGSFEYVVVPKTAGGGGSLPVLSPVTGTRGAPQTPQNVVASTNDTNAVTVVWDAVPKASGYEVKVENWDVAINRTERTVTVDEACFVDTELPQPGLGRYTVTAVYPNGVKGEPSAPAVGHAVLDTMKILGASTRWPWNGTVDLDVEYKTVRPRFRELFGLDNLPYPTNVTLAATTADGASIAVRTLVKESPLDTGTYTVNRAEVPNGAQDPGGTMIFRGSGRTRLVWDAEADAPDRAVPGATLTLTVSDDRCRTTDSCRIDLDTTKPRAIPLAEEVAEISLPWAARWADETSASLNMQDGSDVKVVAITRYNAVTNVVNTLTMLADEGGMLTNRIDYGVTVLECTFSNRATGVQTTYTRQFIRAPVIPATAARRPGQNAIDVMWTVVDGCTYYQVVRRTVYRDGTRGAWENRMGVSPSGAEGRYPDIGVDALTLYEFAVCPKYADPSDYGYVTAEPVVPSAPVSVLGARLDLYNLSVGDPWDCTVGVDFAYASCRLLSDPTDLAHVSLKDLTGGTNVSARTLALDGVSVSNALFTLDLDPAQGAVSTGRLAWNATADLPNAYLTNVVLEVKMQPSGTTAVTAPFTLDTRGTRATFDALGPWLDGGATAVTETVAAAYGTLPAATRAGYRLAGWTLGVTNGAPQAREGEAPLRLGPHTLYARWAVDPTVSPDVDAEGNSIYVWEVRPDGQTARICGFRDPNLRVADLVLPDAIGGHPVTEIADCAFANSASGLTALTLPVYCTTVGRRAFSGIKTLTGLAFTPVRDWASPSDAGELAIGAYAFAATGLTAAFLPVEVAQIGDYAFADCRKLTEATVLGRPAVGLRPFRRAGIDAGTKPTIYLHRDLANDADYLGQITQGFGNDVFAVRTDAVVRGLSLGALAVPAPGMVRLSVDVERASTWGEVDASRLRVEYRARLGDAPTDLVPRAVASEPDGSLTVEVDAPEGPSGFFRVKLVE